MARAPVRPDMTERQLSHSIVQLATRLGWRVHTLADSRSLRCHHPGFPDLILAKGTRLLAVELKAEKGRMRPGQQGWLDALALTGAEAYLWRPCHWLDGTVEAVLRPPG